jgi:hypothetical protein
MLPCQEIILMFLLMLWVKSFFSFDQLMKIFRSTKKNHDEKTGLKNLLCYFTLWVKSLV